MHDTPANEQCQTPHPKPRLTPIPSTPYLYTGHNTLLEYTFGQFASSVPAMLPPNCFCKHPHWQGMRLLGAGLEFNLNQKDRDLSMVKSAFLLFRLFLSLHILYSYLHSGPA